MSKSSLPNHSYCHPSTVLLGTESIVLLVGMESIALQGIVAIVLADVEFVGRLAAPLVLVRTQWASRLEDLGSHELSRLFGHFDFESFVLFVD